MSSIVFATVYLTPTQKVLLPLVAICTAVAVGRLAWVLFVIFDREVQATADSWEFDAARRIRLRRGNQIYRFSEPLVDDLASFSPFLRLVPIQRTQRNLAAGASDLPWKAEEFAAVSAVEGIVVGSLCGVLSASMFTCAVSAVVGVVVALAYLLYAFTELNKTAVNRLDAIRRRLPYAVDLMALMMEAGAGFRESLAAVAQENHDHPLGEEFAKVHYAVERGQPLRQALIEMRDRLNQDDIKGMVFDVLKAEELGSPLTKTFLTLADDMRLKRFQWAQKKAGEAESRITHPGMVLMVACLIVAIGPFILRAVSGALP
jgi:tight adherence protein C